MTKKILHLTLKKKWFDLVASGIKKYEYREITPYWRTRLIDQDLIGSNDKLHAIRFDEVYFRNGYTSNRPFAIVEWKGLQLKNWQGKLYYAIKLGKVLETQNWSDDLSL